MAYTEGRPTMPDEPFGRRSSDWLLERIDRKVDLITDKLNGKADRDAVHAVRAEIDAVRLRVEQLERRDYADEILRANASLKFTRREKVIGGVVAGVAIGISVISLWLQIVGVI